MWVIRCERQFDNDDTPSYEFTMSVEGGLQIREIHRCFEFIYSNTGKYSFESLIDIIQGFQFSCVPSSVDAVVNIYFLMANCLQMIL